MPVFYPPQSNANPWGNLSTVLGLWDKFLGPSSKAQALAMSNAKDENTRANTRADQFTAAHLLGQKATQAQLDAATTAAGVAKTAAAHDAGMAAVDTYPDRTEETNATREIPLLGHLLADFQKGVGEMGDKMISRTQVKDLSDDALARLKALPQQNSKGLSIAEIGSLHNANAGILTGRGMVPSGTTVNEHGVNAQFSPEVKVEPWIDPSTGKIVGTLRDGHGTAFPAEPKRTEREQNAALARSTMFTEHANQDALEKKGFDPTTIASNVKFWETQNRQYQKNGDSFGEALLRLLSGGAITDKEITSTRELYFPGVKDGLGGHGKEMIEFYRQKREAKIHAIDSAYNLARDSGIRIDPEKGLRGLGIDPGEQEDGSFNGPDGRQVSPATEAGKAAVAARVAKEAKAGAGADNERPADATAAQAAMDRGQKFFRNAKGEKVPILDPAAPAAPAAAAVDPAAPAADPAAPAAAKKVPDLKPIVAAPATPDERVNTMIGAADQQRIGEQADAEAKAHIGVLARSPAKWDNEVPGMTHAVETMKAGLKAKESVALAPLEKLNDAIRSGKFPLGELPAKRSGPIPSSWSTDPEKQAAAQFARTLERLPAQVRQQHAALTASVDAARAELTKLAENPYLAVPGAYEKYRQIRLDAGLGKKPNAPKLPLLAPVVDPPLQKFVPLG